MYFFATYLTEGEVNLQFFVELLVDMRDRNFAAGFKVACCDENRTR